jgi:hypothetical protein
MYFDRANISRVQNSNHRTHSKSTGLVNDMVPYISQFIQWFGSHRERVRGSDDSSRPSKPPVSGLRGQGAQTVLLKNALLLHFKGTEFWSVISCIIVQIYQLAQNTMLKSHTVLFNISQE